MDNAYHGHTNALIDLSPYKFNSKGGSGKKDYVHVLDMPDPLRGKWRYQNSNWIQKYIDEAKTVIRNKIKLTVTPNINITFVKEKNETPELEIATISASDTSLFMAKMVEKKAEIGITK